MSIINILSPHVADLIAAGEVVERPASVVKELVENAIDAGARNITVEIQSGGMRSIRVTDDGCGMSPEDAGIAFLRHATSKLKDEYGLEAISTLGFRGEALAAISSVSHIDLLTRERGAAIGTQVILNAGDIEEMGPAGCPEGTTMIVRDLFFNTPARLKFMKTDRAESSACINAALRCALGHPEVSVRMIRDGEEAFFSPGDGQIKSAVYSLLGRDTAAGFLECKGENSGVSVSGYVSAPHAGRGNRALQFFFLNGRTFRSSTLQTALEQAYTHTLLSGRYPACVLHLTLSYGKVDVNVHPTKSEVKFSDEKSVYDAVYYAVLSALQETDERNTAEIRLSPSTAKIASPKQDFYRRMTSEEFRKSALAEKAATSVHEPTQMHMELPKASSVAPCVPRYAPPIEPAQKQIPGSISPASVSLPSSTPKDSAPFHVIGETMNTYILVETGDSLLLIDKHACHERIIFDRLIGGLGAQMSQSLLTPITFSPGEEDVELLENNMDMLEAAGFELDRFGKDGVIVRSVPADSDGSEISMLEEIVSSLRNGKIVDKREALCHTIACKAAIKAGSHSDITELKALAEKVINGEIRYCPHGRPVSVRLTKTELDKQFKRIV